MPLWRNNGMLSHIDKGSEDRGYVIGGKEKVTYQDMMKCCWPAYLTVMYDVEKIGMMHLWGMMGKFLLTNNIKCRYEVYRIEKGMNPIVAGMMTVRNMWYGLVKWGRHVSRNKNA